MKNFPSSYPTDHHGLKAESRQYALPVRDQTVSYRRKQITECPGAMPRQHIENLGAMPRQESLGAMPRRHIVALWSRLLNEKQQICGLMADLTEQAMTANDANERLTVHSRENLISALFYTLGNTGWRRKVPVMMSSNMELQKLNLMTIPMILGSGMMRLIDNPGRSTMIRHKTKNKKETAAA